MKKKRDINLIVCLLFLAGFFIILVNLNSLVLTKIDNSTLDSLSSSGSQSLDRFFLLITSIGEFGPMMALSLILVLSLYFRRKHLASLLSALSLLFSAILVYLFKFSVYSPRPLNPLVIESTPGFPSAHSAMSLVFFSLLVYFYQDKIKSKLLRYSFISLSVLLVLLIGFSRIYLRAHFPSDVLGGFLLGAFVLSFFYLVSREYQ